MFKRGMWLLSATVFLLLFIQVVPAFAHGDKVIPQVPDGTGGDGTSFRTKFDLTNLGPANVTPPSFPITKVKVLFFQQDGRPWTIATNLGTASEFTLNLGRFQTLRLETLGTSPQITAGYVIIQNNEPTTNFVDDYELAITVFYEVSKGGQVIDTVSVPVGQPTVEWNFPVQIENSQNLHTGFAVVNLTNVQNRVTLRLWRAGTPSTDGTDAGSTTLTLDGKAQKAVFLYPTIFSNQTSFKGMLQGYSDPDKPVAILALLQTPTSTGVQYATMVPSYIDSLRRNTYMYLRQGYPLDADLLVSDYFLETDQKSPWDLQYSTDAANNTKRGLETRNGAAFAPLGNKKDTEFDALTIETLRGLQYTTNAIDLSDGSSNLAGEFAFAVKTNQGRYAKIRVYMVITRQDPDTKVIYKDLALEIYTYR